MRFDFNYNSIFTCCQLGDYSVLLSPLHECEFSPGNPRNGVHSHGCYEVCFVLEGSGFFMRGGTTYPVGRDSAFIVSPDVRHEIICGEDDYLKLWFFTFLITERSDASAADGDTAQDLILGDFLRGHSPTARNCGFLHCYWDFLSAYALKGGSWGMKSVSSALLLDCLRQFSVTTAREGAVNGSSEAYQIAAYIRSNIRSGVSIDSICRAMHISQRSLFLLFHRHFETTPYRYISRERVNASISYLGMGFSVSQVAELMNFSELSSFSRLFKRVTGHSPNTYLGEFRKENVN